MAHGEEAGEIAIAGACSCLRVGYPSYHVLLLQPNVDDIALRVFVLDAQPFVLVGLLVVDGDVLHGVGGQVFKHQLAVVTEELLAVEQQVVDELAVVVNAPVALQFHARQLTDEGVEHRPLGQDEGIGIIY